MYTRSENCPRADACVRNGQGLIHIKHLTDKEGLYGHRRMFAHITVDPGCSVGYHDHQHETEFYYIIKGEAVFQDDDQEVLLHAGDIAATGYGHSHGLINRTEEPVELIALSVME